MTGATLQKRRIKKSTKAHKAHKAMRERWMDKRQVQFLKVYLDPKSPTFRNAYQSAIKAGYSKSYALSITSSSQQNDWLPEISEKIDEQSVIDDIERNLKEYLNLPSKVIAMGPFGPIFQGKGKKKKPIMVYAGGLLKLKLDTTKFLAERLVKSKYGETKKVDLPPMQTLIVIHAGNGEHKSIGLPSVREAGIGARLLDGQKHD